MLAGRYRIEDVLGRGGMSTVYRATDVRLGQTVALKQLDLSQDPDMTRVLLREARLLAKLEHPNLVKVRDCFGQAGLAYLVTDYIQGRDLQTMLETSPGFGPDLLLDWALQILDALEYLHGRKPAVLYRDLKPANLILEKSTGKLKLIDFGIARKMLPGRGTTELLRGFGTSGYAPIEQYGAGTDVRSDLYSLGATLYALLTRATPPDAVRLASGELSLARLDPRWQPVVHRLMQLRKEDRFQTAAEVRKALTAPQAPPAQPVSFCPFRDTAPVPDPLVQPPAPPVILKGFLTVDVVYRGDSPVEAQRIASRLAAPGQAARTDYYETFPGVVKGCWRVLLAQRRRQDSSG